MSFVRPHYTPSSRASHRRTNLLSRYRQRHIRRAGRGPLQVERLEPRLALALSVTIDYSYDTNNFFDTQAKRDLLQSAADVIANHFGDELLAITPGPSGFGFDNTWTARFRHPATGVDHDLVDLNIAANEILVFAGGRDLGGSIVDGFTLGVGGPGGVGGAGTSEWIDTILARGQDGALDATPTDFGPWGGSIAFTSNSNINWHFGSTTSGLDTNESDFYSVALHEFAHLFGIGIADSWFTYVDDVNLTFSGPASVAEYDGTGDVPLHSGLGHWAEGTTDGGNEAAMDPNILDGTRKLLTDLDLAGLADVGWEAGNADLLLQSVTTNGFSTITITYEITGEAVPAFDVALYSSTDGAYDLADTLLDEITISNAADRTVGVHVLTFTIGSAAGELALPGAGATETSEDYRILAVADPDNLIAEDDAEPHHEDNTTEFSGVYLGANVVYVFGTSGVDDIDVTPNTDIEVSLNTSDFIYSSSQATAFRIRSGSGDDDIQGTSGILAPFWIHGGAGNDNIVSGAGADTLFGGDGNDTLSSGQGDDTLNDGRGDDTIIPGAGFDVWEYLGTNLDETIVANIKTSTFIGLPSWRIEIARSVGGSQVELDKTVHSVTFTGLPDKYRIFSLDGNDDIQFNNTITTTLASGEILTHVLDGGAGNDVISGGSSPEIIIGGLGNDTLSGNGHNDTFDGGAGNDLLIGGAGDDRYQFDADSPLGADTLDESGGGIDTIDYSSTSSLGVLLNLATTGAQIVNLNHTVTLGSATSFENAVGGSLADTIAGNALANRLSGGLGNDSLSGLDGDDVLEGGAGNDQLIGGKHNDSFLFDADTSLGSDTVNESAGGTDTLDFSATESLGVTINLGLATSQVVNGNLSLNLLSNSTMENVVGGSMNDSITGNKLANRLEGRGGNDMLAGAAGNDTYWFNVETPLGSDTLNDSGGTDLLDFSSATSSINVDLSIAALQAVHANLNLSLSATNTIDNVTGGSGNDSLLGNTLKNVLIGGAGNDSLDGRTSDDTYVFDADTPLGEDSIADSAGADTLDFSATSTVGIQLNLGLTSQQVVNPNLKITLASGNAIENATGGSQNDALTGNSLANTLLGNAGNDNLQGETGNDKLTGGAGDDSLIGGGGNDSYVFDADTALGADTVDESGGGTDTLDFSATTSQQIQINLSLVSTQIVNPNLSLTLSAANHFENLLGGALDDQLTGNSLANTLTGNAGADTLNGADGHDTITGGAGNDQMIGGGGNDRYLFDADSALGSDSIDESGGGIDTLDFAATTKLSIVLDLNVATSQMVNSNLNLSLGSSTTIENVLTGSQADTILGNALDNVITGNAGADTLNGRQGNDTLTGAAGDDALTGGEGDDLYIFDADAAIGTDTLDDSGGGFDVLDYSLTTGQAISINLANAALQTIHTTNHKLVLNSAIAFEMVIGSSKNDTIVGNELDNILIGGLGNDSLSGAGGLDILIGGAGVDTLGGGAQDDILIAGTTSYDKDIAALRVIRTEWISGADYTTRTNNLRSGIGGIKLLAKTTVKTDTSADTLTGDAERDWFFAALADSVTDKAADELIEAL